jgi:hypothetical protein
MLKLSFSITCLWISLVFFGKYRNRTESTETELIFSVPIFERNRSVSIFKETKFLWEPKYQMPRVTLRCASSEADTEVYQSGNDQARAFSF